MPRFKSYMLIIVLLVIAGSLTVLGFICHCQVITTNANDSINNLQYRWVLIRDPLDIPGNVEKVQDIMLRAKNDGYNGIVISEIWKNGSIESLDRTSPENLKNLTKVLQVANELGLGVYPTVLSVGYANSILSHDPNLVEGLPVRDALFVVHNGQANLVQDPAVSLKGGDFESASNGKFNGWDSQDGSNLNIFTDIMVKHGGSQSMRIEANGDGRIIQNVTVSPFRQYHLSYWMKTQDINLTAVDLNPYVQGLNDSRLLTCEDLSRQATQDWTRYDIVFDSLDNNEVQISLGVWDGTGGKIWLDDANMEELGPTNIVRRSEYPLVVKGEDGTVYSEGIDYQTVTDPLLGMAPIPGVYDAYHASPAIIMTNNSRIKEGERLRVSYYYAGIPFGGPVAVSLTDPKAESLFRDQISQVNNTFHPNGFFIAYDEIRVGNWEVRQVPMTQGQVLAYSINRDQNTVHAINPNAKIFVWSDMFDPYANAVDNYFLVNGTCNGSYHGLQRDTIVVNWNLVNYTESTAFFGALGNPQILAGYYNGKSCPIDKWLEEAKQCNANVVGVMYTTWDYNYTGLEAFAKDAWGG